MDHGRNFKEKHFHCHTPEYRLCKSYNDDNDIINDNGNNDDLPSTPLDLSFRLWLTVVFTIMYMRTT